MKKTFISALAVVALLAGNQMASAQQESKPLVVVSFAGYDQLKSDIAYLGKLGGSPQMADNLEGLLGLFTGGQGLAGVDKSKPWGTVVTTDGFQFSATAFLPVTDLDQLTGALAGFVQPKDAGDGIKEIQVGENPLYVKQQGNWAFLARDTMMLTNLPDDPGALLQGLEKEYDLAVRAYVNNIPDVFRQMAIDQMKIGVEQGLQPDEDETDEEFQARVDVTRKQVDQMITMINDLNTITVGWAIDQTMAATYLDFGMTALPDTETAAKFAAFKSITSNFAGFTSESSIFSLHATQPIAQDEIDQLLQTISTLGDQIDKEIEKSEEIETDEDRAMAKDLVAKMIDVAKKTVQGGKIDGAVSMVGEGPYTLVAGGKVADTEQVSEMIKSALNWGAQQNDIKDLKIDEETADGVTYHSFGPKQPKEENKDIFGEDPRITIGVGAEAVYLAIGQNGIATIKEAIAQSAAKQSEEVSPMEFSLSLTPFVEMAAKGEPDNMQLQMLAQQLESTGKDHIRVISKIVPNGSLARFLAEEDVLTLFGKAAAMGAPGGGGPGGPGGFPPAGGNDDF